MSPLHAIGDLLRYLLMLIPLEAVRALFVAIPLAVMIWIIRLPSSATSAPGREHRWDEDLRIWAWVALAMQVLFYCIF